MRTALITFSFVVMLTASLPTRDGYRPATSSSGTREAVQPNDNRTPAGSYRGDTLVLRLVVGPVDWHILTDTEPAFPVLAFGEQGKPLTIPGPLLRVRVGTPIHVTIRNPLEDTLIVRGLAGQGVLRDSLLALPGSTAEVSFVARHAGTYYYWGVTAATVREMLPRVGPVGRTGLVRPGSDSQLAGAFIVDPPGPIAADRILVITELHHAARPPGVLLRDRRGNPVREFTALNGKAWPYTERLTYALGDSVRWRVINATFQPHPMHLHGFYFRVDSRWDPRAEADSIYTADQRRMAVTESPERGQTISITWSPDRPGGWIFHCHLTNHAVKFPPLDQPDNFEFPAHGHGDADNHALTGMNGLVIATTVTGNPPAAAAWRPARRMRLFVQSDSAAGDSTRRFGYVLQRGAEPRRDSVEYPGPVLVLTRGEPTSIEIVNRSGEPTAVHWHGIELESYYDGAVGWGGTPGMQGRTTPAVRSGSSFEVRITPKRAGTFMYHTHFDEIRQQYGGLVGALIVLEPGERWDPSRDLVFLLSDGVPQRMYINGSLTPAPRELTVGTTYRLRIADIAVYRTAMRARLRQDSAMVSWRPVAKDGFALPEAQATLQPSLASVVSGETADFEFTPDRPGDVMLEVGPLQTPAAAPQGAVRLRVVAKRGGP